MGGTGLEHLGPKFNECVCKVFMELRIFSLFADPTALVLLFALALVNRLYSILFYSTPVYSILLY